MDPTGLIVIFLFALASSFVQRVTGFGFGIMIMTVLPHVMPSYAEATTLSGMLAIVGVLITGFNYRRFIDWKKLLPILLTFIVASFAAVKVIHYVQGDVMKNILGVILIIASVYFFFISDRIHVRPTLPLQIGMGTLSGFMGGLFAMQGPPAVIYFLSTMKSKDEYIALTALYFIITNSVMTVFRLGEGFVTASVCEAWLVGLPAVLAGLWIGGKVYRKISSGLFRKIVYAFLAVGGVVAIIS